LRLCLLDHLRRFAQTNTHTHTHITITQRPSLPLFSSLWKAIDRCWSASKKVICLTFKDTSLHSPLKKKNLFLPSLCCLATCSLCWPVFGIDGPNYFTFNVGTIPLLGRERKNYNKAKDWSIDHLAITNSGIAFGYMNTILSDPFAITQKY